eukprot:NODE_16014_length_1017_cov_3.206742.p5 GENE.NODE_16014_length_1017_cov_3.206742~~NODE_16014_length_1017_cov_3.206742.p5  ORF type:complete len:109 (-),score=17.33 NODE_16014_length_1017_cov_3.206742:228-554(-)
MEDVGGVAKLKERRITASGAKEVFVTWIPVAHLPSNLQERCVIDTKLLEDATAGGDGSLRFEFIDALVVAEHGGTSASFSLLKWAYSCNEKHGALRAAIRWLSDRRAG